MSEVLTIDSENLILITGLVNVQTIRTCEMLDIQNIIIVRNKKATPEMLELAEENDIIIIQCPFSMFKASGILYQHGIKPIY
jgi:serine kinase of HPr protein (carbohydrate metabolism regulator)